MTTTDKLADALRQAIAATDKQAELLKAGVRDIPCPRDEARDAWREALAAYDAQQAATWTEDDDSVATSEGWLVSRTSDGFHEIQKVDDADVFTEDTQAIAHVYWMAGTGSEVHKRAIAYTLRDGNEWTYTQASIASRAKRCEHIRMCVNAHDGLVSALQACQRVLDDNGGTTPQQWIDAEAAARAALAQAGAHHA